jgi:DNA mismatch repair protein MutL
VSPVRDRSGRPWIRPLPERLINKIAAGEVVERPAAVVKELVENAIDAGADTIDIIIEKSGIKLIRIVDNGCGIAAEQMEIAFSRHATSKISEFSDLDRVTSYGFRGEALPSIASVSRMRMVSRAPEQETATEIIIEGGVVHSVEPIAGPRCTTVEVENLFFNTPARRKFLKAETTEARHISRTATALAIGKHLIGFSYTLNGRNIFSLPKAMPLFDRVVSLLRPGQKFVRIDYEHGPVRISGCIGLPEMAAGNRLNQYLFINGRYVQAPSLAHAFAAGYGEMLPRGNFPIGALLLEIDPTEVDVNVHPAKTEVRLSHERDIYDAIYRGVKESLRHDGIIPSFHPQTSPTNTGADRNRVAFPGIGNQGANNRSFVGDLYRSAPLQPVSPSIIQVDSNTGEVIETPSSPGLHESSHPLPGEPGNSVTLTTRNTDQDHPDLTDGVRLVGRFSDLYLLLQAGGDLYIVDQHTAHERVLYEQTLKQVENQTVVGQAMLLPVQVELTPEQLSVFDEAEVLLNGSGFEVAHFGGRMINVTAVPSILSRKSPEKIVRKVIDDLASLRKAGYDFKKAMAQSIACRAAVMSGDRLSDREAEGLLEQLLACDNRYTCPHGRPTFIRLGKADLDKQFGRG